MSADDVHDAIDHARGDWSVSDDAMRWTPEPPDLLGLPGGGTPTFLEVISRIDDPEVRARLVGQVVVGAAPLFDAVQQVGQAIGQALDGVAGFIAQIGDRGHHRE